MKDLESILRRFRRELPNDSRTARAIDDGASLEEISQAATADGVHELATILFEAEQEETGGKDDLETDLATTIATRLRETRADLPNDSKTARAIDRGAPWGEICACAQEEGLGELATTLFQAEQEKVRSPVE